jgi:hypothetical protein
VGYRVVEENAEARVQENDDRRIEKLELAEVFAWDMLDRTACGSELHTLETPLVAPVRLRTRILLPLSFCRIYRMELEIMCVKPV